MQLIGILCSQVGIKIALESMAALESTVTLESTVAYLEAADLNVVHHEGPQQEFYARDTQVQVMAFYYERIRHTLISRRSCGLHDQKKRVQEARNDVHASFEEGFEFMVRNSFYIVVNFARLVQARDVRTEGSPAIKRVSAAVSFSVRFRHVSKAHRDAGAPKT